MYEYDIQIKIVAFIQKNLKNECESKTVMSIVHVCNAMRFF